MRPKNIPTQYLSRIDAERIAAQLRGEDPAGERQREYRRAYKQRKRAQREQAGGDSQSDR